MHGRLYVIDTGRQDPLSSLQGVEPHGMDVRKPQPRYGQRRIPAPVWLRRLRLCRRWTSAHGGSGRALWRCVLMEGRWCPSEYARVALLTAVQQLREVSGQVAPDATPHMEVPGSKAVVHFRQSVLAGHHP